MDSDNSGIVDLGDARFQTRGTEVVGPIEVQTMLRFFPVGLRTDD
ncbi:hypothetical protein [Sphingopyxis witflariensis]|nr:hypothetical protein [Sphingopyxis witflariensis]